MTIGHDCKAVRNGAPFIREGLSTCTSSEPDARCELSGRVTLAGNWLLKRWEAGGTLDEESQARSSWAHRFSLIVRDDQIVEVEIYFGIPHEG